MTSEVAVLAAGDPDGRDEWSESFTSSWPPAETNVQQRHRADSASGQPRPWAGYETSPPTTSVPYRSHRNWNFTERGRRTQLPAAAELERRCDGSAGSSARRPSGWTHLRLHLTSGRPPRMRPFCATSSAGPPPWWRRSGVLPNPCLPRHVLLRLPGGPAHRGRP
jgi:hypothetical protein